MLKIENLRKVFRTDEIETIALDNVSFAIEKGEFVAVMGPSGCGKSTLLNILGLLDNPTSGSYTLLGQEVSAFREKDRTLFRKGNIGFVFQSFNLIDELNVFENVELPLIYLSVKASERRRRVTEILNRMNISHRAKHFPQQLSGGQQQRVAIARAVIANPQLILADLEEAAAAVDIFDAAWTEAAEELTDLKPDGQLVYFVTSDLYHLYEKYLDSFANTEAAYIGRTEGRPVLTYHGIPVVDLHLSSYLRDTTYAQSFCLLTDRRNLVLAVNTSDFPGNEIRMWYNPDLMENRQRAVFMAGCEVLDEKLVSFAYKE